MDATAVPANRGGVGRYVDALVANLVGSITIACQSRDAAHYGRIAPNARILAQSSAITSVPLRLLWEQIFLPRLAASVSAQIIHSPHYTIPLLSRKRHVVTFHDGTFFTHPAAHGRLKRTFFSWWMRRSSRRASTIIVPSLATAQALAEALDMSVDQFTVIHLGVDRAVFCPPSLDEVTRDASEWGLSSRQWVAFLGTIEPRKNVPALVRAYRQTVRDLVRADPEANTPWLVIAGADGWETGLDAELAQVERPAHVVRLGYVPVDSLRSLLGGAALVVYPSLGEGFGLPVLEAMSCGAPVLTTTRLSLVEVGGDAVAYTDVDDRSISAAMTSLLQDDDRRADLSIQGVLRAQTFTWLKCASLHWDAYRKAVER